MLVEGRAGAAKGCAKTVINQETEAYFLLNLHFTLMPCSAEKNNVTRLKGRGIFFVSGRGW